MPEIYQNTIIIDQPITQGFPIGYFFGNVILPLAMVLYVILHFRDDKNIYLYTAFMTILFFTVPAWFVVIAGIFLISVDNTCKWAKKRKESCTFVDIDDHGGEYPRK